MTTSGGHVPDSNTSGVSGSGSAIIGRTIGEFEIRREIGRGGMGTVYEAWQKSLNRVVAIKILAGSLGLTETSVVRFQREARAAAKLHHPNIVPIYALGEDGGLYYYAMEYVEGSGLNEIIQQRIRARNSSHLELTKTRPVSGSTPAPDAQSAFAAARPADSTAAMNLADTEVSGTTVAEFDQIARLTASVAGALDYAHKAGVIHRDIKPHNFILGNDGRLRVADFGLARVLEQPGVTVTGDFIGSPLYMSPEQIAGDHERVDHRTDIYSLGATLYEWLTTRPPFPGETRDQVITKIVHAEPTPPRVLDDRIPVDLETICLKAMEKDPSRRYASSANMADDLERFLDRSAIRAKREGVLSRAGKFVTKNPWPVAAAMFFLVAATVAVNSVVASRNAKLETAKTETQIAAVQEQLQQKSEQFDTLQQQTEDLTQQLQRAFLVDPRLAELGSEVFSDLAKSLSAFAPVGGSGTDQTRTVPQPADLTKQDTILIRRISAELIAELRELVSALPPEVQLSFPGLSDYLYALQQEDPEVALVHVNFALDKQPDYFDARNLRALIHLSMYRFEDVRTDAAALIRSSRDSAAGYLLRGMGRLFVGDARGSIEDLDTAIILDRNRPAAFVVRAAAHARRSNFGSVMDDCDDALSIRPGYVVALFQRVDARVTLDDAQGAVDDLTAILEQEPDSFDALDRRGDAYEMLGEYDLARADYAAALKLQSTGSSEFISLLLKQVSMDAKRKEASQSTGSGTESGDASLSQPRSIAPTNPGVISRLGVGAFTRVIWRRWW